MTDETATSDECFRAIHRALASWVMGDIENGFVDFPLDGDSAQKLCALADLMREIEGHTEIVQPIQDGAND